MRKYLYTLITLLLVPVLVNAETLEYNICKSGCEYSEFETVMDILQEMNDNNEFNGQDIIINFKDNNEYTLGNNDNVKNYGINASGVSNIDRINSFTINGNNNIIKHFALQIDANKIDISNLSLINISTSQENFSLIFLGNEVKINNIKKDNIENNEDMSLQHIDNNLHLTMIYADNLEINNSNAEYIMFSTLDSLGLSEKSSATISDSNIVVYINGCKNTQINNSNFFMISNNGIVNIYNTKLSLLSNYNFSSNDNEVKADCYNCDFYKNIKYSKLSENEANNQFPSEENVFQYGGVVDLYGREELKDKVNSYIHFDEEKTLKVGETMNLLELFKYRTGSEISWQLDNEGIVNIDNELIKGIKEGLVTISATTDEGHIIYNLKLIVEKETIPEKIDKMTIKVPITGSKIKAWVVVVSVALLGVIGTCSYMLIRRKK